MSRAPGQDAVPATVRAVGSSRPGLVKEVPAGLPHDWVLKRSCADLIANIHLDADGHRGPLALRLTPHQTASIQAVRVPYSPRPAAGSGLHRMWSWRTVPTHPWQSAVIFDEGAPGGHPPTRCHPQAATRRSASGSSRGILARTSAPSSGGSTSSSNWAWATRHSKTVVLYRAGLCHAAMVIGSRLPGQFLRGCAGSRLGPSVLQTWWRVGQAMPMPWGRS